jgi:hypothetical protein
MARRWTASPSGGNWSRSSFGCNVAGTEVLSSSDSVGCPPPADSVQPAREPDVAW